MRFPGPQDATFWYNFESLTDDNKWTDQSKNALHATPQAGFSSPAYGLSRTIRGKGYATFTGAANCYATLPLRFYDVAPTGEYTWVISSSGNTASGAIQRFFDAYNGGGGGVNRGIASGTGTTATYQFHGYGTATAAYSGAVGGSAPIYDPTSTTSRVYAVATAPKRWQDRVQGPAVWSVGAYNPVVYDTAIFPHIGCDAAGGSLLIARTYFLALFPFAFSHQQAQAMSDWLRDQI